MEVTEEMIFKAILAYGNAKIPAHATEFYNMKAALETVFASIPEKPDNSIFNSFPPELPIMPKDDGWVKYDNFDEYCSPDISPDTCVNIKLRNGDVITSSLIASSLNWPNITSYKIIKSDTVKPEKKAIYPFNCDCKNLIYFMSESGLHCINCFKGGPEKKTLLQYADKVAGYKGELLQKSAFERREVYRIISEYLEGKCG